MSASADNVHMTERIEDRDRRWTTPAGTMHLHIAGAVVVGVAGAEGGREVTPSVAPRSDPDLRSVGIAAGGRELGPADRSESVRIERIGGDRRNVACLRSMGWSHPDPPHPDPPHLSPARPSRRGRTRDLSRRPRHREDPIAPWNDIAPWEEGAFETPEPTPYGRVRAGRRQPARRRRSDALHRASPGGSDRRSRPQWSPSPPGDRFGGSCWASRAALCVASSSASYGEGRRCSSTCPRSPC